MPPARYAYPQGGTLWLAPPAEGERGTAAVEGQPDTVSALAVRVAERSSYQDLGRGVCQKSVRLVGHDPRHWFWGIAVPSLNRLTIGQILQKF